MFLSVIIPTYNEEKRIGATLESVDSYLKKQNYDYEIIVVTNNCQDQTCEVVRGYQKKIFNLRLIDLENKGGKGKAVKRGVEAAEGDYILFMDADNSTRIREFEYFLSYFTESRVDLNGGYQVVIGSRAIKEAKVIIHQSIWREFFGRAANFFVRIILLPEIYDTQCGFKVFTKEAAKKVFAKQKILGWGFDMEILVLARHFEYKVKEVPITWYNSPESKVSLLNYFTTFWELFKIKWNLWRGKYNKN
ncbi:MAG: dolichyl-phosphate beta-glucosyltransferase [Patescibacteria group bacterium]